MDEPVTTFVERLPVGERVSEVRKRIFDAWLRACRNESQGALDEVRLDHAAGREFLIVLHLRRYLDTLEKGVEGSAGFASVAGLLAAEQPAFGSGQRPAVNNGILEYLIRVDLQRELASLVAGAAEQHTVLTYLTKLLLCLVYDFLSPPIRMTLATEPRWWIPVVKPSDTPLSTLMRDRLKTARNGLVSDEHSRREGELRKLTRARLVKVEAQFLHSVQDREDGNAVLRRIDDPVERKRRAVELAQAIASDRAALKVERGRSSVILPFTIQHEPPVGAYPSVELTGSMRRTFDYEIKPLDRADMFHLPPNPVRSQAIDKVACALHADGAAFVNGTKLAAIKQIARDGGRLTFTFQGVQYFDYFASNVITDTDYRGPERPECVWSQPRGAFPGSSALVVTSDDFVVLSVREGRCASDRRTINTSISGGIELDDLETRDGVPAVAPFESALLREGTSEVMVGERARAASRLTYLGFYRNLHRNFLAELLWLVELRNYKAKDWIEDWKTDRTRLDEGFELADEVGDSPQRGPRAGVRADSVVWLPSLLFVHRSVLVEHALEVLNPATLSFAWLTKYQSVKTALKTSLDGERSTSFHGEERKKALRFLAEHRQPAPPLLATLGAYMRMLARSSSKSSPADS